MEVLIILVPLSLLILAVAVWLLFKMIGSGQLDESDGAAWRILLDNDTPQPVCDKSRARLASQASRTTGIASTNSDSNPKT